MKKLVYAICSMVFVCLVAIAVRADHSDPRTYRDLAIDSITDRAFAVREDEEGVDVIDIKTSLVTQTILSHSEIKAISLDEERRMAAAIDEKHLYFISADTLETLQKIDIGDDATSVAMDPDQGLVLVTQKEETLAVVDVNTYKEVTQVSIAHKPVSLAVDPGLRIAVVAHQSEEEDDDDEDHDNHGQDDNITIIDLNSFAIVKTLQAGKKASHVAVNPSTHQAVITNEKSDDLTVIDLNTQTITGAVSMKKHPKAAAFNACLNTLAVAGGEDKSWLLVLEGGTWTTKASYDLTQKQRDIAVHPSNNKAYLAGKDGLSIIELSNPAPDLTALSPNKALRGGSSFTLSLEGKGIISSTEVYLNGTKTEATYQSCGVVEAVVPDTYLAALGPWKSKP